MKAQEREVTRRTRLTVTVKKTKLKALSSLLWVYIQVCTGIKVQLKCIVQVTNPSMTIIGMSKNKDTDTSIRS
jgi:hypothetical protein